ncbi:MAG: hypothetical protein C4321_05590, partial [Chloroflexota bacterium]
SPPKPPTPEQVRDFEAFQKIIGPPKIDPPRDRLPPVVQKLQLWAQSHPKLAVETPDYMAEEFQAMYEARRKTRYPLGDMPLISLRSGMAAWIPSAELLATI